MIITALPKIKYSMHCFLFFTSPPFPFSTRLRGGHEGERFFKDFCSRLPFGNRQALPNRIF
jgi:hypothetical protein